jgi:hypothetical protein
MENIQGQFVKFGIVTELQSSASGSWMLFSK